MRPRRLSFLVALTAVVLALVSCGYGDPDSKYPSRTKGRVTGYTGPGAPARQTIFGEGGLDLFGNEDPAAEGAGAGIGVNFYLWRASLDTISFLPLASADPFGGVIITDWYTSEGAPNERYKLTVYILSRALRADGLRVAVFRQRQDSAGAWLDTPVDPATTTALENTILTRARQMRIASLSE